MCVEPSVAADGGARRSPDRGGLFAGTFVKNTGAATPANWFVAQTAYSW
jgi:hypothetical protein